MDSICPVLLRLRSVLHSWYKTPCVRACDRFVIAFALSAEATPRITKALQMTSSDQPLSSEPLSGENPEDAATIDTFQTIARQLRLCNVKFLRVAWCDTANVIRAKAAYVPRLEGVFKDGVALCVGGQVSYTQRRRNVFKIGGLTL